MATDEIEMGKLIQAVQTLSKDVDRLSKRLDSLESQLDKGKGLFVGVLLVASGAGAVSGGIKTDVPHIFDVPNATVIAHKVFFRKNEGGDLPTVSLSLIHI